MKQLTIARFVERYSKLHLDDLARRGQVIPVGPNMVRFDEELIAYLHSIAMLDQRTGMEQLVQDRVAEALRSAIGFKMPKPEMLLGMINQALAGLEREDRIAHDHRATLERRSDGSFVVSIKVSDPHTAQPLLVELTCEA